MEGMVMGWRGDQLGQRYDQGKSREGFHEPASTAPCLAIVEPSVSGGHSLFLDMTTSQKQPWENHRLRVHRACSPEPKNSRRQENEPPPNPIYRGASCSQMGTGFLRIQILQVFTFLEASHHQQLNGSVAPSSGVNYPHCMGTTGIHWGGEQLHHLSPLLLMIVQ